MSAWRHSLKFFILLLFFVTSQLMAQTGMIAGQVVDQATGEAVIGANVYLADTEYGYATDFDGTFTVSGVPEGVYILLVDYIGYAQLQVRDVEVVAGQVVKFDLAITPEVLQTEEVVVTAEALENTEAALLKHRSKAASVSDAISAEEISKSGSSDAAAAMKKVTGASVVGDKYVYVRGLGDRYTTTTMNGAEVPSADPDKNSFQMDLIPTSMLDNINTKKTFTPDQPGTFTGGLVDVNLKDYPEELTVNANIGMGYNTIATFADGFLQGKESSTDWLGLDDGQRATPAEWQANDVVIPPLSPRTTREDVYYIDRVSRAFSTEMVAKPTTGPLEGNMGVSLGNTVHLDEDGQNHIGYFLSYTYKRDVKYIEDGKVGIYKLNANYTEAEGLEPLFVGTENSGIIDVNWGSIANLAWKNRDLGKIKYSFMYNQGGESLGRYILAKRDRDRTTDDFETQVLSWTQRSLALHQIDGEHVVPFLGNLKFDWKLSTSLNSQREPDQRYFFNIRTLLDDGEYLYRFDAANTQPISRFFRDLDENKNALYLNAEFPFTQWDGLASKVKVGAAFTDVERRYDQRRYDYLENRVDYADYGNPDSLFQNGVGIIDTTESRFDRWLGLTINNSNTRDSVNYFRGDMNVQAYYGMVDMPLTPWLRFIGGYRVETTELNSFSLDPTVERGRLEDVDWLPSFNLVFSLAKSMNLRLVYTNTIARPTFRELAPYVTFEYSGGFLVEGNPALQRTLIRNYDIRWEWFLQPGEIFAVSAFYKDFEDPILRFVDNTFSTDSDKFTFINATEGATVYGLELEARKRLDFISEYFQIGTNLSLVFSEQPLTDDEKTANFFAGDSSTTRPFIGQSPYLFNLNFTYDNWESKTSAGIFYNIFGDRLFAVSRQGTPDIYERAYGTLDFKMSQGFGEHLTASFSVKNILDPEKKFSYRLDNGLVDKEFLYSSYKAGTSFGVSLAYKL